MCVLSCCVLVFPSVFPSLSLLHSGARLGVATVSIHRHRRNYSHPCPSMFGYRHHSPITGATTLIQSTVCPSALKPSPVRCSGVSCVFAVGYMCLCHLLLSKILMRHIVLLFILCCISVRADMRYRAFRCFCFRSVTQGLWNRSLPSLLAKSCWSCADISWRFLIDSLPWNTDLDFAPNLVSALPLLFLDAVIPTLPILWNLS